MGMFDTTGQGPSAAQAQYAGQDDRMNEALRHRRPDTVRISDFFWGGFIRRWRHELHLPADASPYYHYDLDWIVTVPDMDPHIRNFATS